MEKNWSVSDARSRLREFRGKDKQSTKIKYAVSWKLLNDPLTRAMVSDKFMEAWHDRTFPKLVNPYKFRRMEKELTADKGYHLQKHPEQLAGNRSYQDLMQQFEKLSEELIELSCNSFPPSVKMELERSIKAKEKLKIETEGKLFQFQEEVEPPRPPRSTEPQPRMEAVESSKYVYPAW